MYLSDICYGPDNYYAPSQQCHVPQSKLLGNRQYGFYTKEAGLTFRMEQNDLLVGISPRSLAEKIMRS